MSDPWEVWDGSNLVEVEPHQFQMPMEIEPDPVPATEMADQDAAAADESEHINHIVSCLTCGKPLKAATHLHIFKTGLGDREFAQWLVDQKIDPDRVSRVSHEWLPGEMKAGRPWSRKGESREYDPRKVIMSAFIRNGLYGYDGNSFFCNLRCGYKYAVKAAAKEYKR